MRPIRVDDVVDRLETSDELVLDFLRTDSLSLEIYRLDADATDPQEPHTEDEVYYILEGRAAIRIEDDRHPVEPGDVIYVERGVDHRFVDIGETLIALVMFAPPFGSLTSQRDHP